MHWRQASPGSFFWKEVDEGWICYDQRSGNTRLFSPLARFISDLFEQNSSPLACSEIIDEVMRAEPDADLDECRVEVEAVLRILSEAHLILPVQP